MNLISFFYISVYDWFYRDGNPRHPKSYENSQERAAYILTVSMAIWGLLILFIYTYLLLHTFKIGNSIYAIGLVSILSYYLFEHIYIKNKKYEDIYKKYKIKFGGNNLKYQLIAWSILVWIPFLSIIILTLLWHHLI